MLTIDLLNQTKFLHKLQQYQSVSRKNMADVINSKLGDVAVTAIGTTYRSNSSQIASELERIVSSAKTKGIYKPIGIGKNGKIIKRKIGVTKKFSSRNESYDGTYRLVNWLLKNRNLPTLGKTKIGVGGLGMGGKPTTIGRLARRLVAGRKRSVNYIRNGWAAAASIFGKKAALTRGDYSKEAIMRLGGGKKADDKKALMEGIIFNRAGDKDTRFYPVRKRAVSGAVKIGGAGLAEAVQIVMKDMSVYLARQNKKTSDKLGL